MHSKVKTIIVVLVAMVCVVGLVVGIVFGVSLYQKSKMRADVIYVSNINMGDMNNGFTSDGFVTSDKSQTVLLSKDQVIKEVYVQKGQQVKEGDKLLAFDVDSVKISIEKEKVEQNLIDVRIQKEQNEMEKLKQEAVAGNIDEHKESNFTKKNADKSKDEQENDLGNESGNESGNEPGNEPGNESENGSETNSADKSKNDSYDESGDDSTNNSIDNPAGDSSNYGRSKEEIEKDIKNHEKEIKTLEVEKKKSSLHLGQLEKEIKDGVIYAKFDGVVKKVGSVDNPLSDGSDFLVINDNEGIHVEGYLSEIQIRKVKKGQKVEVTSYENEEEEYEAKIDNIDPTPISGNEEIYLQGNQNVSKYKFTAFIKDSKNLKEGDGLSLTIKSDEDNKGEKLFIDQSYVRMDEGTPYVYISYKGRLKKQYVKTGKIVDGTSIEIISGLKASDRIAFPYGKNISEGVKTRNTN